jgi:hypothetical protein
MHTGLSLPDDHRDAAPSGREEGRDGAPPLERRLARYLTAIGAAAVRAALAALPPGPRDGPRPDPRLGLFTATGPSRYEAAALGQKMLALDGSGPLWANGLADLDPFALLKLMSCNVLAVLAIAAGAEGPSAHHCDDALGGIAALRDARDAIADGRLDRALVVGFDDLSSDHARAELAASARSGPGEQGKQLALLALTRDPHGALATVGAIAIERGAQAGPVGGGAALLQLAGQFAEGKPSLADGKPWVARIAVDRGAATVELLP